jgi:hypothetical protein
VREARRTGGIARTDSRCYATCSIWIKSDPIQVSRECFELGRNWHSNLAPAARRSSNYSTIVIAKKKPTDSALVPHAACAVIDDGAGNRHGGRSRAN